MYPSSQEAESEQSRRRAALGLTDGQAAGRGPSHPQSRKRSLERAQGTLVVAREVISVVSTTLLAGFGLHETHLHFLRTASNQQVGSTSEMESSDRVTP